MGTRSWTLKKKKKKDKKSSFESRLLLYVLIIASAFAVFYTAKWREQTSQENAFNLPVVIHHVQDLDAGSMKSLNEQISELVVSPHGRKVVEENSETALIARPVCPKGEFKLQGMTSCRPWLNCHEIYSVDVTMETYFDKDLVKKLQRGSWKGHQVAIAHPISEKGKSRLNDFDETIRNLRDLQSPYVTQLVGYCSVSKGAGEFGRSYFLTQYYDERSLENYLQSNHHVISNPIERLKLAASYVKVLLFLHTLPEGARVMCDSNQLSETLKQYVVSSDHRILLADLNDLPSIDKNTGGLTQCKHQDALAESEDIDVLFLAPEQVEAIVTYLPNSSMSKKLDKSKEVKKQANAVDAAGRLPPSIDEKSDVFKIPNVTEAILLLNGNIEDSYQNEASAIWKRLEKIHLKCKDVSPKLRPTVAEVLTEYLSVIHSSS